MSEQPTLVTAGPVEEFAMSNRSAQETFVRELQERVKAELTSDFGAARGRVLNGPLGEQIAIAAESLNLTSFVTPEQVAEGICEWLATTFLNQPLQGFGPRDGACSNSASSTPREKCGGGDGSRVVAPTSDCPFCGQDFSR